MADLASRHSPGRRAVRAIPFALLAALGAAAALALYPPRIRPSLPPDSETRGASLEQALAAAVTKVRDPKGEDWAVSIDPADINAWLATRLPKWIAHDPSLAHLEPLVGTRIAAVRGAILVERPAGPLVATVPVEVSLDAAGLRPAIGTVRVGRLPLPGLASFAGAGALEGQFLAAAELASPAGTGAAVFSLADGRRVQLVALEISEGAIRLAFRTTLGNGSPAAETPAPRPAP